MREFALLLTIGLCAAATKTQRAIAAATGGRLEEALVLFEQITHEQPTSSEAFSNLCVTHMRLSRLAEAREACLRAVALDSENQGASANLAEVERMSGRRPPEPPPSPPPSTPWPSAQASSCPADATGRAACALSLLEERGAASEAVAALCGSDDSVRVRVDASALARGRLAPDVLTRAKAALRVCGAVVLSRVFSDEHTARLAVQQADSLARYLDGSGGTVGWLDAANTTSAAVRSDRRFEVKFEVGAGGAVVEEETLRSPIVRDVLSASLGGVDPDLELELDTLSHITALPGAAAQHWHRDTVRQLHPRVAGSAALAPAHSVVAFVPLLNVTSRLGPTELLLGSHLGCEKRAQAPLSVRDDAGVWTSQPTECTHVVPTPFRATARAGAALLLDSRLLHRGGPNRSSKRRPQLYLAWARQWFVDRVNFHEVQTAGHASLPPKLQRLLSRLDAREYVGRLEAMLRDDFGVDLAMLRSERDATPT